MSMMNLYYSNFTVAQNQTSGGNLESTMYFLLDPTTCDKHVTPLLPCSWCRAKGPKLTTYHEEAIRGWYIHVPCPRSRIGKWTSPICKSKTSTNTTPPCLRVYMSVRIRKVHCCINLSKTNGSLKKIGLKRIQDRFFLKHDFSGAYVFVLPGCSCGINIPIDHKHQPFMYVRISCVDPMGNCKVQELYKLG